MAAPGGDGVYQFTAEAVNGEVLSTWPSSHALAESADFQLLTGSNGGKYGYLQVRPSTVLLPTLHRALLRK